MSKLNIKSGDTVVVIAGDNMKDVGKQGKVMSVDPKKQRVVVQGRKMIIRHTKPRKQGEAGGRIEKEGTIHVSNVMLICPNCSKATRVGHRLEEVTANGVTKTKKHRVCKKCGKDID